MATAAEAQLGISSESGKAQEAFPTLFCWEFVKFSVVLLGDNQTGQLLCI